jgi:hypothetical protein
MCAGVDLIDGSFSPSTYCAFCFCVVQWKNNMRHGLGSSIEPDGTIYHGEVRLIRRIFLSVPF